MGTFLWVVYDIVLGIFFVVYLMDRKLTAAEKSVVAVLVVVGLAVASWTGYSEHEDGILMSSLKEGQDFTKGQLSVIGQLLGASTNISSVNDLKKRLESMHSSLNQYAMPRMLSESQKTIIGDYLRKFEPHDITVKAQNRDIEADHYAAEIIQALMKGGWKVEHFSYDEIGNVGLTLEVDRPIGPPYPPLQVDPTHPMPDVLILRAFGLARVPIIFGGGGNRQNYACRIEVGQRPLAIQDTESNPN